VIVCFTSSIIVFLTLFSFLAHIFV
jgi:hypothetical protein